jgi:beta-lactamase superfamily II metal-dependent hydrolase
VTLPVLETPSDHELRMVLFGPGYGESVVLGTAASGWVVIDSLAADDHNGETVNPAFCLLDDAGVNWSLLMLTHPHKDHAVGMAQLITRPDPGVLACVQKFVPVATDWDLTDEAGEDPGATATLGPKEQALMAMRTRWDSLPKHQRWDPRAGKSWGLHDLELTCLWPTDPAVAKFKASDNPNTLSTALLVSWHEHRLLLGADVHSEQWEEIAGAVGDDVLANHLVMKVPHHGSENAVIDALNGITGDRLWVLTPWDEGAWRLPRFDDEQGVQLLHAQHPTLHLTSLPFRAPSATHLPFHLTRQEALELRNDSKLTDQRAIARALPRPVRDGWLDIVMRRDGTVTWEIGPAAGCVVP